MLSRYPANVIVAHFWFFFQNWIWTAFCQKVGKKANSNLSWSPVLAVWCFLQKLNAWTLDEILESMINSSGNLMTSTLTKVIFNIKPLTLILDEIWVRLYPRTKVSETTHIGFFRSIAEEKRKRPRAPNFSKPRFRCCRGISAQNRWVTLRYEA